MARRSRTTTIGSAAPSNDLGRPASSPRTYLVDIEPGGEQSVLALAERYREAGLLGDVIMGCLRESGFELDRWLELVRTVVARYGDQLHSLQITNEPNLTFMDGAKPYVLEALVHGVLAAKPEARRLGLDVDDRLRFGPAERRHDFRPSGATSPGPADAHWWTRSISSATTSTSTCSSEPIDLDEVAARVETTLQRSCDSASSTAQAFRRRCRYE